MDAISQTTFSNAFFNENVWIPIKNSLRFAPKGPINYIPALVQIMAWRRPGDKPLYMKQWWLDYWRIYASLGLNELKKTKNFNNNSHIFSSIS